MVVMMLGRRGRRVRVRVRMRVRVRKMLHGWVSLWFSGHRCDYALKPCRRRNAPETAGFWYSSEGNRRQESRIQTGETSGGRHWVHAPRAQVSRMVKARGRRG